MTPVKPIYPDNDKDPNFRALVEQAEYLLGVLYGDEAHRKDNDLARDIGNEIDPYGPGTRDFWRGVVETGGYMKVEPAGRYEYPRFRLEGGYKLLRKFLDFCEQELAPRALGLGMRWDADGKLNHQAMGCCIRLGSQQTQEVVRLLYLGATVSRDSFRLEADRIVQWVSKR